MKGRRGGVECICRLLAVAALCLMMSGCGDAPHDKGANNGSQPSSWRLVGSLPVALQSVAFTDAQHGWCIAAKDYTLDMSTTPVKYTVDGGRTWSQSRARIVGDRGIGNSRLPALLSGIERPLWITASDSRTLWLCYEGLESSIDAPPSSDLNAGILVSHDAGKTWHRSLALALGTETILSTCWTDSSHGWALCSKNPFENGEEQFLTRTVDGGKSWQRIAGWRMSRETKRGIGSLGPLQFADENHGWAIALVNGVLAMARTDDGGRTWVGAGELPSSMSDFQALDSKHLWATNAYYEEYSSGGGTLAYSDDGGTTWRSFSQFESIHLFTLLFANQRSGWIGSDAAIYGTSDGGATWRKELTLGKKERWVMFTIFCHASDQIIAVGTANWDDEVYSDRPKGAAQTVLYSRPAQSE